MAEKTKASIVPLARKRFAQVVTNQSDSRMEAITDLKMLVGGEEQWEESARAARNGRPTLTVNKLPKFLRSVTGDQRRNRPSVKVRPVDSQADPQIANIFEGHIRNIEYVSNAAYCYDSAFKHATSCGFPGYWRILADYNDDDSFEQDISLAPVRNHFSVYMDHSCVPYQGKEQFAFITETLPKAEFKNSWPDADLSQFTEGAKGDEMSQWFDEEGIRIAEYFYREPAIKVLLQLETGEVIEESKKLKVFISPDRKTLTLPDGKSVAIVKERSVKSHRIMWAKICGLEEPLEGPREWAGKYIPIIPVMPEEFILDGKTIWKGLIRDARDPQRLYNYVASANIEAVALSPKSPIAIGKSQLAGNETQWRNAHLIPYPYLVYNDETNNTNAPHRIESVQTQPGLLATMQQANMDFEDTIGIFRAGLGAPSNEKSGIAIKERKESSDVGTYEYHDNLARAIQWSYRVLIDLIPRIYDTERGLRLMNPDESESFAQINKEATDPQTGERIIINDITVGKYDITATLGPAYTTQRQEGQQVLSDVITSVAPVAPQAVPVLLPRLFKLMDFPEAQEITKELKKVFGQEDEDGKPKQIDPMQQMQQEFQKLMMLLEAGQKKADIAQTETAAMLNTAKAEAAEAGQQLAGYKGLVDSIIQSFQPGPAPNPDPQSAGDPQTQQSQQGVVQ